MVTFSGLPDPPSQSLSTQTTPPHIEVAELVATSTTNALIHPSTSTKYCAQMSDREGFGGGDDEHTLPKATVYKLISGESNSGSRGFVASSCLPAIDLPAMLQAI